jgi:hypothetical protein
LNVALFVLSISSDGDKIANGKAECEPETENHGLKKKRTDPLFAQLFKRFAPRKYYLVIRF